MKDFNEMEEYAKIYGVPIMEKEGINFLLATIEKEGCKSILEIGTAIAYSTIQIASLSKDIKVISIERDLERYKQATINIKKYGYEKQIQLVYGDALEVSVDGEFDFIFIDAAKAQYIKFFERFTPQLIKGGIVLSDNLGFHGMVTHKDKEMSRNLRQLVRKIQTYIDYLKDIEEYQTEFYNIGDGIAISKKG